MKTTSQIGAAGERAAVEYLRSEGFLIVDTNWRSGRYELDIVATKDDALHFIEVKCRKADGLTSPEFAMNPGKSRAIVTAANLYIAQMNVDAECHIDLVAVDSFPDGGMRVRYIPDAVNLRW